MNIKDVENLANLARIELSEEEKKSLLSDMDSILGYVKQIERPTTEAESVEALPQIINVWREDLPAVVGDNNSFSTELITGQFPDAQDGFLKVKKIL